MNEAFVTAVGAGLKVSAAFAAAGAVVCWLLISPTSTSAEVPAAQQATGAAPAGVEPQGELAPYPGHPGAEPAPSPGPLDAESTPSPASPAASPPGREGAASRVGPAR